MSPSHPPYPTSLGGHKAPSWSPRVDTAASHYLSILHLVVYICQCYSLTLSHLSLPPPRVLKSILYICIFNFHLQLLQNIGYSPCFVQYILEPISHPIFCTSRSPTPILPLPPPLVTTNLFSISESSSFLLYSLVCCIFKILHISDNIQYLSLAVWLCHLA